MFKVKDKLDFVGVNFYFKNRISISGRKNDNDQVSDFGWWMVPSALYGVLQRAHKRYGLPIYITENGVADREDQYRKWWLDESFEAMKKALEDGIDVRGYMHWSLLDNFEWAEGFWPRFGLVSVDRETFDREIKGSGWYYRDLIKKHS